MLPANLGPRRFWISAALTVPLPWPMLGELVPATAIYAGVDGRLARGTSKEARPGRARLVFSIRAGATDRTGLAGP